MYLLPFVGLLALMDICYVMVVSKKLSMWNVQKSIIGRQTNRIQSVKLRYSSQNAVLQFEYIITGF
jgi:hypothetical protein